MAGRVQFCSPEVLVHCHHTYFVSKVPIDILQGLQLAPFLVKTSISRCLQLEGAVYREVVDLQLAIALSCVTKPTDGSYSNSHSKLHA